MHSHETALVCECRIFPSANNNLKYQKLGIVDYHIHTVGLSSIFRRCLEDASYRYKPL